ncbi:MAG: 50S ribosomal protein L18 [Armatimonadetes bacterium CG_4_10_14_3_um_filter_66_18]|nr:50S ribosomal protein L18 [Armatimonadota bacterium]OIO95668.1 MAG: 50S ribosomal protein L18 [Armatimonadetes bacterium CG2_30_66_41]PIU94060.1 MAG: 50S ribosomal protein L18 [Armatimonadetes bacterium CG06_land_8_20_14_3_00_66_21]PIW13278.1 MAG: 50S ribosomal protein L18 [Armatimonadetes bacterium CG17_big_fil_post_rev_8_21_14_2_50_66_6]PIX43084.1 MAG: 50S ribosomal protein L18 [Armatimonadetes bacterium CG_4_8_14_3_um_filter_66_20]PIY36196.1 MAG: 50S ribosomal protein L18 [Armatimonadete
MRIDLKEQRLLKRKRRVRHRVHGTAERPRLSVYRSLRHIYAQLIDDDTGQVLASASTLDPALRQEGRASGNVAGAAVVGELAAKRALEKGLTKVVFDRNGRLYHGRLKSLADGARAAGLEF